MKTIFITVFEGVEAKNILRTDVLPTMLADPEVRLVLLMKNQERVERYKNEFGDKRITYEIAPYSRAIGRGLDKFFGRLKFILLRTGTKNLQRRLAFETSKNYFVYYAGYAYNVLLARSFVRRLARVLDFLLVRNNLYSFLYDKYKPDLVLLAHLFEEPEIHVLREAKKRGIRTIGFVNSWDKLTVRCIMRLLPDKLVVFNDINKKEAMMHNEVKEADIFVSGIPQYDYYFRPEVSSRADFFRSIGVDFSKKLIVYAPAGHAYGDSDWDIIDFLHDAEVAGRLKNTALFVRFQPNDILEEAEVKKRPWLRYDYPGMRFSANRGVDWDMNSDDLKRQKDTVYHMALTVSYASSFAVDAIALDRPVVNVGFEIKKPVRPNRDVRHFFKVEHYQNVLKKGGVRVAGNGEELIDLINRYLENPKLESYERKITREEQCKFTDGKSGKRLGKFILEALNY